MPTKTSAWFHKFDRNISAAAALALISRCIYLSDSFVELASNNHWLPVLLYSGLSVTCFTCTSEAIFTICRLWLEYADRARDSNLNRSLKQVIFLCQWIQVPLLLGLYILLYYQHLQVILWTLSATCLLVATTVIASGYALKHSLTEYENGSILRRVSRTVNIVCASCFLRLCFYSARVFFEDPLQRFRESNINSNSSFNLFYSAALLLLVLLTELLPLALCSLNLKQVYHTALTYTPSPALVMKNTKTLLCLDERPCPRPLFHSVQGHTPVHKDQSLIESTCSQYQ